MTSFKLAAGLGLLAGLAAANAGTITGTVEAKGTPEPPGGAAASGNYQSHRYKFVEKVDYDQLRDFIIYIDQPVPGAPVVDSPTRAVTTQKDASFDPHVLPVAVGTTVRWPNEDDIFHNVFSMSEIKPFDLGYYKKDKVPEIVFDKPGRVDVFCAIHTKMHCIILVLPNRFFAVADSHGRFTIKDVPPGTYRLRAWHERLPSQVREVVVPSEGEIEADFTLGLAGLPKY
jgi:plastocyanin